MRKCPQCTSDGELCTLDWDQDRVMKTNKHELGTLRQRVSKRRKRHEVLFANGDWGRTVPGGLIRWAPWGAKWFCAARSFLFTPVLPEGI